MRPIAPWGLGPAFFEYLARPGCPALTLACVLLGDVRAKRPPGALCTSRVGLLPGAPLLHRETRLHGAVFELAHVLAVAAAQVEVLEVLSLQVVVAQPQALEAQASQHNQLLPLLWVCPLSHLASRGVRDREAEAVGARGSS